MALCSDLICVSDNTTTLGYQYSKQYKSLPTTLGGSVGTSGFVIEGNTRKYQFHVTQPSAVASTVFSFPVNGNSHFMVKAEIVGVLMSSAYPNGTLSGYYNYNNWASMYCISGALPVLATTVGSGTISNQYSTGFAGASTAISYSGLGSSLTSPATVLYTFTATPAAGTPVTLDAYFEITEISNTLT